MNPIHVHTLGDSTLDNIYWMLNGTGKNIEEAKSQSVEGQLEAMLQDGDEGSYQVVSHAYDGFTTHSLQNGDDVGDVLDMRGPKGISYLNHKGINPNAGSYQVKPIENLKTAIENHPAAIHYVVMSVCGNDFRVQLGNPIKMLKSIPEILARYDSLLDELVHLKGLKDRTIRPILMFQYRVDAINDSYSIYSIMKVIGAVTLAFNLISAAALVTSLALLAASVSTPAAIIFALVGVSGFAISNAILPLRMTLKVLKGEEVAMATIGTLMERFYQPILKRAKEEAFPVFDLPNTFNPYKPLYLSGIEPGVEGGRLIAEGINHIVKNHDFDSSSKLYAKNDSQLEFTATENPGYDGWRVSAAHPEQPK